MAYDELDLLVGQMFIFGFQGLHFDSGLAEWYSKHPVGGIILFDRNCQTETQIQNLIAGLRSVSRTVWPDLPLVVGIDQENGSLSPLRGLIVSLPGNMGLAATGEPRAASFAGYTTGCGLMDLGFNLDFAPVLDLALTFNPVVGPRSFGDRPETATEFGRAFADGLTEAGVLFSAKHFPGHGSCAADSHVELPVCPEPLATLSARDMVPFRALMNHRGGALMMAHVKYPDLDPERPASLSARFVEYIREELHFQGVLMTDCLEMKAIQHTTPYPEDALTAIEAGMDLVLISHTPEHQEASYRAVKEAARTGRLPLKRIEESVRRIEQWKRQIGNQSGAGIRLTHVDIPNWSSANLAEKSLAAHNADSWQFDAMPVALITPEISRVTLAETFGDFRILEESLADCAVDCCRISCEADPGLREINRVLVDHQSAGNRKVVFVLSDPTAAPGQVELINELAAKSPVLLISTRSPEEYWRLNLKLPVIFTFSTESAVLRALARVLAGKAVPGGQIPLSRLLLNKEGSTRES